jgi:hypothetical protein
MGLTFNPFTGKLDYIGSGGGGGSPTGPAGGDLSGTYPNPTVDGLQGRPVSNAIPVNGQVLQYDGANWVPGTIPSGGSGGGGVIYYLNFNTAADAPVTNIPQTPNATKELGIVGDTVATSYLSPILSTASYDFLASFVTDLNVPSATAIPAGIWDFNTFVESTTTNSANEVYFKIEILKYDGVNAPTLLATSNDTYIYDPTEITQYVTSIVMPQTTILSTDRIVVYLYGRAQQNNRRLTFHFGGQYPSHTHSTMPSVTGTGVAKVVNGVFQSPASTIVNSDVSASAAIDQGKISNLTTDLSGKVAKTGDTMTGKLNLPASTTANSSLNIQYGVSPTSPNLGDIWATSAGIRMRRGTIGSPETVDFATLGENTFTKIQTISASATGSQVLSVTNQSTNSTPNIAATFSASGTDEVVRITQSGSGGGLKIVNATGTGECLRIEDESPETTPFVVSATGKVGIGTSPDTTVGLKLDSTGVKFNDNTVQTTAPVAQVQTDWNATTGIASILNKPSKWTIPLMANMPYILNGTAEADITYICIPMSLLTDSGVPIPISLTMSITQEYGGTTNYKFFIAANNGNNTGNYPSSGYLTTTLTPLPGVGGTNVEMISTAGINFTTTGSHINIGVKAQRGSGQTKITSILLHIARQ